MSLPTPPPSPSLEIPSGLDIVYANLARISHSPADIVIDFAHILPGDAKATVKARILMSPLSAKLLVRALTENSVSIRICLWRNQCPDQQYAG